MTLLISRTLFSLYKVHFTIFFKCVNSHEIVYFQYNLISKSSLTLKKFAMRIKSVKVDSSGALIYPFYLFPVLYSYYRNLEPRNAGYGSLLNGDTQKNVASRSINHLHILKSRLSRGRWFKSLTYFGSGTSYMVKRTFTTTKSEAFYCRLRL